MLRRSLLVFCLVLGAFSVHAQAVFTGRVFEDKTRIALNNIRVLNLNTRQTAVTTSDGSFVVNAKVGDKILFKGYSYLPDTLLLTDLLAKEIYLVPEKTMLNQVNITDTSGRTGAATKNMAYVDPQFHGQTVVDHRDKDGNIDGGITLRLHYFTRDASNKRKAEQKAGDRKVIEQINQVFVPENIGKYVPLKDEDLKNFIVLYIPEVVVYTNKDFNLVSFI